MRSLLLIVGAVSIAVTSNAGIPIKFFIGRFPRNATYQYQATVDVNSFTSVFMDDKIFIDGSPCELTEAKGEHRVYGLEFSGRYQGDHTWTWKDLAGQSHSVQAHLDEMNIDHMQSFPANSDLSVEVSPEPLAAGDTLYSILFKQSRVSVKTSLWSHVASFADKKLIIPASEFMKFGPGTSLDFEVGRSRVQIQGDHKITTLSESRTSSITLE